MGTPDVRYVSGLCREFLDRFKLSEGLARIMRNVSLSMTEIREVCAEWARNIGEQYTPDMIIFIAKSGFIIASEFAKYYNVPLDEISAHRLGGKLREYAAPLFKRFPLIVRNKIVGSNFMYSVNGKKTERNIEIPESLKKKALEKKYKNILLIDDSIDTGWTFLSAYEEIKKIFPDSEIKKLAMIKMHYAEERFSVDYHLYEDTLMLTPAQVDSKEYGLFISQYEAWKNEKDAKEII